MSNNGWWCGVREGKAKRQHVLHSSIMSTPQFFLQLPLWLLFIVCIRFFSKQKKKNFKLGRVLSLFLSSSDTTLVKIEFQAVTKYLNNVRFFKFFHFTTCKCVCWIKVKSLADYNIDFRCR